MLYYVAYTVWYYQKNLTRNNTFRLQLFLKFPCNMQKECLIRLDFCQNLLKLRSVTSDNNYLINQKSFQVTWNISLKHICFFVTIMTNRFLRIIYNFTTTPNPPKCTFSFVGLSTFPALSFLLTLRKHFGTQILKWPFV